MKEELIRVLNNKLDSINSDINSLKELNEKIDEESEQLSFVDSIINIFDENGTNNPLNFDKIVKEDFTRALDVAGDEVKNMFNGSACNYDGLVYLISGIKNGVSISLTNEQMNGIEYFIQTLTTKKADMKTKMDELEKEKNNYPVSDINELKTHKDKYEKVIDGVNNNKYIKDIDLLKEAINYSQLSLSDTINVLSYVLEYNADLYKSNVTTIEKEEEIVEDRVEEPKEETPVEVENEKTEDETPIEDKNNEAKEENSTEDENVENEIEQPVEEQKEEIEEKASDEEQNEEDIPNLNEFHFNQVENDNLFDLPNITFNDDSASIEETHDNLSTDEVKEETSSETIDNEEIQEINPVEVNKEEQNETDVLVETPVVEVGVPTENTLEEKSDSIVEDDFSIELPHEEENALSKEELPSFETPVSDNIVDIPTFVPPTNDDVVIHPIDTNNQISDINADVKPQIDNDFKDIINEKVDYESRETQEEEKTSTRELHKIFGKYGIEENVILNELIDGDTKEYQNILDSLKKYGILDYFKKNKELLIETLLYSGTNEIDNILRIVKEDLSVDDEDYEITLKIVINTIPSIFVKDGGNYDNFMNNVDLFKRLEINLINLFDFSKEIFVADHDLIENNLAIVNKYDVDITYRNAKYYLLIPNIAEKIDYYVESVYEDKTKKEVFDGIKYIKDYAAKLNVVTDETIKRLRYASTNGQKVFGNKPGSLSGEITNLKVHALAINDDYMNSFFNNEFVNITPDEVRQFVKLIQTSSNVGNYNDELDKLNTYHNGLRYNIEGINVSYNKVNRNYSVLRSYGIDSKKALQFAVCYNLVITKDEYNKLSSLLDRIGGNV